MKELFRKILYPFAVMLGGYFIANEGSAWCRFLNWIYGEDERAEYIP